MGEKVKLNPNIFSYPDFEHAQLHMEISLGGMKKENITLKMYDDSFYLHVPGDDFEYVASRVFSCPVKAKEAKAKFKNGLLKVMVPYKDKMEDAVEISIS